MPRKMPPRQILEKINEGQTGVEVVELNRRAAEGESSIIEVVPVLIDQFSGGEEPASEVAGGALRLLSDHEPEMVAPATESFVRRFRARTMSDSVVLNALANLVHYRPHEIAPIADDILASLENGNYEEFDTDPVGEIISGLISQDAVTVRTDTCPPVAVELLAWHVAYGTRYNAEKAKRELLRLQERDNLHFEPA